MIEPEIPEAPGSIMGHNAGSVFDGAIAAGREALDDTPRDGGKTFAQRRDEFVRSADAQIVKDRQSAADAADTIKLASEVWSLIDAARRELSDPFRETHLKLSSMASDFWAPVVEAMGRLRDQINAWSAEEDLRIEAQQREQEADMQRRRGAAAAPPAPRAHIDYTAPVAPPPSAAPAMQPARKAKIRGDLGATITAREVDSYEIEDFSLLPAHITQSPTVRAAILTVVKATVKHMGVPPGIRVTTTPTTQIS